MSPMPQRFAIPTNDDVFEDMCLQLLRLYWLRPGLEIFGKRGERQFGIDILDVGGETPIYAAQCKLKEEHKSLPPASIQAEVDQAKQFTPPLGKYAILTTAKVSTQAQRKVREINQAHKAAGLFEVEVLTWDRVCALLHKYSEVQEQFYGEITIGRAARIEGQLVTIKDGIHSLTSKTDGDEIDSEINEARDFITKREFQFATFLLNRTQRDKEHRLTARQRFRVLSNHGAAALGLGKPAAAAKFFLEALQCQPDDEKGRLNEVLAYFLVGDMSSSHAKAESLRSRLPGSAQLTALWLTTAPKEVSLSALEQEISSVLRSDPEVSVALARRALTELAFEKASEYATAAARSAPKWSQPQLLLAIINLGKTLHVRLGVQEKHAVQEDSLEAAEQACSKALDLARDEKDEQTQKAALIHRVDIRLLLQRREEALKDAEDAEHLDSTDPQVMLAVAQVRLASGRLDDGISVLNKAYRLDPRPEIAFMYGKALYSRWQAADIEESCKTLVQIALKEIRPELRPAVVAQAIQSLGKKKAWAEAEEYLNKVPEFVDAVIPKIMRAYLAHYQADSGKAERLALEARSLLATNANADVKEFLARLLMLIGRPADALPLWQELFDLGTPAFPLRR